MSTPSSPPLPDLAKLTGCLFAPGTSARSLFALGEAGALVHISEVERGTKGLTCPDCGGELIAKKGKIKIPHFAHASKEPCQTAGETALHLLAKRIIAEGRGLYLPAVKTHLKRLTTLQEATMVRFDRVEVEPWQDGLRPDLVAYKMDSQGVERALVIEIRVTHRVGDEKIEALRTRGISALEIDLSKVKRELDYHELAQEILEATPRDWLVHRLIEDSLSPEEKRRRAEEKLQIENARRLKAQRRARRAAQAAARVLPPRPASEAERQAAQRERGRWLALGAPDLLTQPGDDGAFAVEPLIWRTTALADLAPWYGGPIRGHLNPAVMTFDLREFRDRDFIKPAFLPENAPSLPHELSHGRDRPKEVSAEDHLIGFRRAFLYDFLGASGARIYPYSWTKDARTMLAGRWTRLTSLRGLLETALAALAAHGLHLVVTPRPGGSVGPGPVARPLRGADDIKALLASGWMLGLSTDPHSLRILVADLARGASWQGTASLASSLISEGFEIHGPGVTEEPKTHAALRRILPDRPMTQGRSFIRVTHPIR